MKILFVADARSPIALNWIRNFLTPQHQVHLASTFPAAPMKGLASFQVIPVAFSSAAAAPASTSGSLLRRLTSPKLRTLVRQWLGILTIDTAAAKLAGRITDIRPDIVHAMRIPYEGMTASKAYRSSRMNKLDHQPPLLISIWGNDFTLHAAANKMTGNRTRDAMQQASAIHADCHRDIKLAQTWGFSKKRPFVVLPGAGGVQEDIFYPPDEEYKELIIVQPRGMRAYVHSEAFFNAIPIVLKAYPEARFVCPAMEGETQAQEWVRERNIQNSVDLLPKITRSEMADLFRKSTIMLSPTSHDGTPNTLLEAMACGCFPVAGDIESIREWIIDHENGLLIDPTQGETIAAGLIQAIRNDNLRKKAKGKNAILMQQKANYSTVMKEAEDFYKRLMAK